MQNVSSANKTSERKGEERRREEGKDSSDLLYYSPFIGEVGGMFFYFPCWDGYLPKGYQWTLGGATI